ncbi:hypothetical protein CHUAL_009856 [Chamberlinius hualienensis]
MALSNLACLSLFLFANVLGQTQLDSTNPANIGHNKYAAQIRECYLKEKTHFEICLMEFWRQIRPLMNNGVPELNIPPMDPLVIDNIDWNEHSAAVQVNAKLTNLQVVGASNVVPQSVSVNPQARTVTVAVKFPYLNATGNYGIKGTIMLLPVNGDGRFVLNMTTIDAVMVSHVVQRGTGVRTERIDLDFTIDQLFLKLNRILRGSDAVADAITNMINDNSQQLLQDIKPVIIKKFEQTFLNLTSDAFSDMPPNAFIS